MSLPLLEIVTPAASGPARRLTTAAKVQAALRLGAVDTALIESVIDSISGECVRFARLARVASGAIPTFGPEVLRATWLAADQDRNTMMVLPWRVPVTGIVSVVEDGTTLVQGTDYRLISGGMLERMADDTALPWSSGRIAATYTAGWVLPDGVPAELEGQVIEQVKMRYLATDRDPALRSEAVPEVWSGTYGVAGGDSIGESGLLRSLEAALAPYRDWSTG